MAGMSTSPGEPRLRQRIEREAARSAIDCDEDSDRDPPAAGGRRNLSAAPCRGGRDLAVTPVSRRGRRSRTKRRQRPRRSRSRLGRAWRCAFGWRPVARSGITSRRRSSKPCCAWRTRAGGASSKSRSIIRFAARSTSSSTTRSAESSSPRRCSRRSGAWSNCSGGATRSRGPPAEWSDPAGWHRSLSDHLAAPRHPIHPYQSRDRVDLRRARSGRRIPASSERANRALTSARCANGRARRFSGRAVDRSGAQIARTVAAPDQVIDSWPSERTLPRTTCSRGRPGRGRAGSGDTRPGRASAATTETTPPQAMAAAAPAFEASAPRSRPPIGLVPGEDRRVDAHDPAAELVRDDHLDRRVGGGHHRDRARCRRRTSGRGRSGSSPMTPMRISAMPSTSPPMSIRDGRVPPKAIASAARSEPTPDAAIRKP